MLDRLLAEAVFAEAIAGCDPAVLVHNAIEDLGADLATGRWLGVAVGKSALAMARGAGPVAHGVAIAPVDDGGAMPAGWRVIIGPHPTPDQRSVEAAEAAWRIADREARAGDVLLALISGGASALIEAPRDGISLSALRMLVGGLMASGAPIAELNVVRSALSRVKAGGLIARTPARVITLAISDVIGDALEVIGSGPTIAAVAPLAERAAAILRAHGIEVPDLLAVSVLRPPPRIGDVARVIAPMTAFVDAAIAALERRGISAVRLDPPIEGEVSAVAEDLAARSGLVIAWGEPTLAIPDDHGEGGRAQQLALELARRIRGTHRKALVVGSDGVDGPRPATRPTPAGAFVDGATWDAIARAGLDPELALARRDAGTALAAVGALVVTGPTGINHADLAILG